MQWNYSQECIIAVLVGVIVVVVFVPFCAIKPKNLLKQGPDTNCLTVVIFDVFFG